MADKEARTSGGSEKGVGGSGERVPEKVVVGDVQKKLKEKKQRELESKWKKNLESTKDNFKRRLVGGKEEHKRKLEEISADVKKELEKIEKMPADKRKKELRKLEETQEKRIEKLINEVEKEAGRANNDETGRLASRETRTAELWTKMKRSDELMIQLTQELNKRRPDMDLIVSYNNQMVDNQLEITGLIEGLEYRGPLQIREYWDFEIKSKIQAAELQTEGLTELKGVKNKVEVLKAKLSTNPRAVNDEQAKKLLGDIKLAKEVGLITEAELDELKIEVARAMTKAEAKIELEKMEIPEENQKKYLSKNQMEDFVRTVPGAKAEAKGDIQKYYQSTGGDWSKTAEMIADKTATHNIDRKMVDLESNSGEVDESIDLMQAAGYIANGEYKRARSTLKTFEKWRVATESPMDPEVMLEGAKKEIVKMALERIAIEGPGAEIAVTNQDVKDWVMEQMNKVVSGGEESTSYSARQYLMDVAGILEKTNLHFEKTIEQMTDQVSENKIITQYRTEIKISDEELELLMKLRDGRHVDRANDDFRDEISSTIIVHEIGNHYSRSGGAEDMVRVQGAISTEQIPKVLKMKSVGKEIKGRLGFYEVEMVKDKKGNTNRKMVLSKSELNDPNLGKDEVNRMHTAEVNKGFLNLVVYKDGRELEKIDAGNFEDLLAVEGDSVKITAGDVLDIMNQERFANPVLSRQTNIREKAEKEIVREAIMKNMGLVDIDGNINQKRVIELLKERHGVSEGITFKLKNSRGEVIELDQVRAKMTMVQVGEKGMGYTGGQESRIILNELGKNNRWKDEKTGKSPVIDMALGGIREDDHSFGDMFNEYKMQFKLAEGVWKFTGLASAHWDKEFDGHTKDWHTKILHFSRYVQMFGIGPAHLRSHINLDYGDFITQRMKEINPELFGSHTEIGKKGKTEERKEIMKLIMKDRDGMFMSRQRFLDVYGRYKQLVDDNRGGEADKFLREMLEEKVVYRFGETKGKILMDQHWDDLKKIDWSGSIDGGLNGGEVPGGEKKGFTGLYWYMKQNYTYANLKWGSGGQSNDTTWGQRLYKESQYLLSADKYRGAMLAWLMGDYHSPNKIIEAISAPGYYGQSDSNRKSQLLLRKWKEYMTVVGGGINPLATLETVKVDREHNTADINWKKVSERWDGTLDYETETLGVGNCLAKRERKLKKPFSYSQISEVIDQFARAGKLMPDAHHDIKGELVGFADPVKKWYHFLDKVPLGLGNTLKPLSWLLVGGFHWKDKKIFGVTVIKDWAPAGVFRWALKKLWKWITDTWDVRSEIRQGAVQGLGESFKGVVKDAGGGH
jgi:hypothetical protein